MQRFKSKLDVMVPIAIINMVVKNRVVRELNMGRLYHKQAHYLLNYRGRLNHSRARSSNREESVK
jgi:hypothetical protein